MGEKLVCDQRSGCVAVYKKSQRNESPGCHRTDERNIVFSDKGARFNLTEDWTMDDEVQNILKEMTDAYNEKYKL